MNPGSFWSIIFRAGCSIESLIMSAMQQSMDLFVDLMEVLQLKFIMGQCKAVTFGKLVQGA